MVIMDIYNSITDIDLQFNNGYSKFTIMNGYLWFNYGYPELYAGKEIIDIRNWIMDVKIWLDVVDHISLNRIMDVP